MNNIWGAYLEDYYQIKLIIPFGTKFESLSLIGNNQNIPLNIVKEDSFSNELYLYLQYNEDILLHKDYVVRINEKLAYHLNLGKITRSERFDLDNYYEGDLGVCYTKQKSIFRLWSPVAKEIILVLNNHEYNMAFVDKGLWSTEINEDCNGYSYYYKVRINQDFVKILDPYALSSNANNELNYVIDIESTYQMDNNYYDLLNKDYSNSIIYEINFRDIGGNIENNESSYLNCIDKIPYFKKLGVTHLQLMPTFAFGGVNEECKNHKEKGFKYNWGYNPVQYMVPCGWYSSNPNDPYSRINELKQFIDEAHKNGLGVNMDVVFNHVYHCETFSLGLLVPGYVYRTDNSGFMLNSSYCGNDIRTEALMNRKFIIDSLIKFQMIYKIDGFRFDLMGLIDNQTILEAKKRLELNNPNLMLYGEGWYMNTNLNMEKNANLGSAKILYPTSYFNDYFRNMISGKLHESNSFILGNKLSSRDLTNLICHGSMKVMPFKSFSQSINYIECHDNYTFYDKMKYIHRLENKKKIIDYCKFGIGLVIISKGIPFIHSGSELLRSKKGNDNSYNASDDINHFPWENINTELDISSYVSSLIEIRHILNNYKYSNIHYIDSHYEFRTSGGEYQIIIKNDYDKETIYFAPLTYLIFDNESKIEKICESLILDCPGIWILKK